MYIKRSKLGARYSRRDFLRKGLYGIGVSAALPTFMQQTSQAMAAEVLESAIERHPNRILVVVELSGGNDGLNTVVPYTNDEYYRVRPTLGIPKEKLRIIDDDYGLHPSLEGFEELYGRGDLAVVHGCGYENPSLSHFASMGFWHTGVPNGGDTYGWVGRFADAYQPAPQRDFIVNVGDRQSLAVHAAQHTPLVFNDPIGFKRDMVADQRTFIDAMSRKKESKGNASLDYLNRIANNAAESSQFVREAYAQYRSPVDYGAGAGVGQGLRKVAALIEAEMPTRVFYVSYAGNAFDTHVHQADLHERLLMYSADALRGFMNDIERMGRGDDVAVVVFTEFGRRVEENASAGTDHGTATPMFILGKPVKGGFYGEHPSLTNLDDGNLIMTTDFRRVYATMIEEWMGYSDTESLLKGQFETIGAFA